MTEDNKKTRIELTSETFYSDEIQTEISKMLEAFNIDEKTSIEDLERIVSMVSNRYDLEDDDAVDVVMSFDLFTSFMITNDKDSVKEEIKNIKKYSQSKRRND